MHQAVRRIGQRRLYGRSSWQRMHSDKSAPDVKALGYRAENGTFVSVADAMGSKWSIPLGHPLQDGSTLRGAELRTTIEGIASRAPRFLFRGWSNMSGGNKKLNTKDAITPLAFAIDRGPASIHEVPGNMLLALAYGHLCNNPRMNTIFSSWTHSLCMAMYCASYFPRDGYVSVIDTARLPMKNIFLWAPKLDSIKCDTDASGNKIAKVPRSAEEFLAFGRICGPAHRAVKLSDLVETGRSVFQAILHGRGYEMYNGRTIAMIALVHHKDPLRQVEEREPSFADLADAAQRTGGLYGEDFRLPMAAYFMALCSRSDEIANITKAYSSCEVPQDWSEDPLIMKDGSCFIRQYPGEFLETEHAIHILRSLVKNQCGSRPSTGPAGGLGAEQAVSGNATDEAKDVEAVRDEAKDKNDGGADAVVGDERDGLVVAEGGRPEVGPASLRIGRDDIKR